MTTLEEAIMVAYDVIAGATNGKVYLAVGVDPSPSAENAFRTLTTANRVVFDGQIPTLWRCDRCTQMQFSCSKPQTHLNGHKYCWRFGDPEGARPRWREVTPKKRV